MERLFASIAIHYITSLEGAQLAPGESGRGPDFYLDQMKRAAHRADVLAEALAIEADSEPPPWLKSRNDSRIKRLHH